LPVFKEGKITRLYVHTEWTKIRLHSTGNDQYVLRTDHPNYAALQAFVLASAVNRDTVKLRMHDSIPDVIHYMTVEYPV